MSNTEEMLPVPARRFRGFRGTMGWVKARLIETADRSVKWSFIGGPFGSNLKSSDYVKDGVRIIQLQNIGDGEFFDDYRIFTSLEKADELQSNNIYPGEIIMSKMGDPVGRACLIPNLHDRYVMCSDGIRLVVDEKAHNKYFVYSLINSPLFRSAIEKTATGSTRKRIGLDELKNLPMRLPAKAEQQKIADCLSSLDELIAAQVRKVDAVKTHKKGLMQQLFPREGETQPRLRLPEFQDAGNWARSQLDRLATKISDGIHTTPVYDESGEYAFINGNNLVNGRVLVDEKTKRVGFHEFNKHRKPLTANTILMSINGTIGNLALFRNEHVVLGKSACFINVDIGLADSVFVYYLLQTDNVQSVFNAELTGSTIKNLSLGTIKNTAVSIPGLPEQQRIASLLVVLDDLVTGTTEVLESLKTHKKGLMQQLFPSAEAA